MFTAVVAFLLALPPIAQPEPPRDLGCVELLGLKVCCAELSSGGVHCCGTVLSNPAGGAVCGDLTLGP